MELSSKQRKFENFDQESPRLIRTAQSCSISKNNAKTKNRRSDVMSFSLYFINNLLDLRVVWYRKMCRQ